MVLVYLPTKLGHKYGVNVGKYSSTMEFIGWGYYPNISVIDIGYNVVLHGEMYINNMITMTVTDQFLFVRKCGMFCRCRLAPYFYGLVKIGILIHLIYVLQL